MNDSITIRCYITGTVDGRIEKEDVMRAYHHLIKMGYNETENGFYNHVLDWVTGDMYIDTDCDIDECEIPDWEVDDALKFIEECIKSDGIHEDEEGQTHLFDPTEYEVNEWELQCRREEELKRLKK